MDLVAVALSLLLISLALPSDPAKPSRTRMPPLNRPRHGTHYQRRAPMPPPRCVHRRNTIDYKD
ncbi:MULTISPECIES: hypothetical protein [Chromohalobacter]|jgi:hypothetical protein|uniref:hypothetical protein n=1 Tax=Chromohalobacter TaxID=42054 RepID=UPI0005526257|nr:MULTISPECIES: hypothetical protein [Chromohalobacter]MDF9434319.1 hypothetical protein [Chromohalobacter israelensis]MDO0946522.1 hypothetical protein [Chromohalobacter salexigens]NQY46697.1 hypothetical protein [Chromohalobacter sp.]NWO56736.1 hypothetical protein [Chromohalobacter salexigens]PWW40572.1 hypothetical protein DFO74_1057 [Chromohalobacter salexigens]